MRGRAGLGLHGVEEVLLLSFCEVAHLHGGQHLHAALINEGEELRDEEGQAYEALHLVLADAQFLGQNVTRPPAV